MLSIANAGLDVGLGLETTDAFYMSLTTKCVGYDIRLTGMVANFAVVVVE